MKWGNVHSVCVCLCVGLGIETRRLCVWVCVFQMFTVYSRCLLPPQVKKKSRKSLIGCFCFSVGHYKVLTILFKTVSL